MVKSSLIDAKYFTGSFAKVKAFNEEEVIVRLADVWIAVDTYLFKQRVVAVDNAQDDVLLGTDVDLA